MVPDKPVSLEVFAEDPQEMLRQARLLADVGTNVLVKIPITNSEGVFSGAVIEQLLEEGVKLNITALMTWQHRTMLEQIVSSFIRSSSSVILSVFAGRIADCGHDPRFTIKEFKVLAERINAKVLWASTRQPYSIIEAERAGADIITVPPEILAKAEQLFERSVADLALETVQMLNGDAARSGFTL